MYVFFSFEIMFIDGNVQDLAGRGKLCSLKKTAVWPSGHQSLNRDERKVRPN
jgi:hypothetical protein